MELEVQKYLRAGNSLTKLEEAFGIKCRTHELFNVVCLNYDQLNSPLKETIVQECRALILDNKTWEIKSWPFLKFFNVGQVEVPVNFDWNSFVAFDKLDGSLIHFWYHNTFGWQIATRSVPDARTPFNDTDSSFRELVLFTLKDMETSFEEVTSFLSTNYCYTFELTGPENQIVVEYKDRKLTLTGVRNLVTLEETLPSEFITQFPTFPLPIAKAYYGWDKEFAADRVETLNPKEYEGYVLLDKNWNRVKIKSEAYCFMSNKRDSLAKSAKARLELILSEKEDDVLSILPKFVCNQILDLKTKLSEFEYQVYETYTKIMSIKEQKEFALEACKYKYCSFLFSLRKSPRLLRDVFKETSTTRLLAFIEHDSEED